MAAEVEVTTENFDQEVKNSGVPVLADFWAEWCMPCKMIAPVLEELADEYDGKLKIAKVDVDSQPELAQKFNVVSIPTLILFKDGEVVNQHIGAGSKDVLEKIFKDYV